MSQEKDLPAGVFLQRDGKTFAARITPPSGKLSARDLEKMAELVRAYEVPMVKLTSGQRIGFYGLSREKIHALCDAMPFRSGGHYVQACPGTDWCKFAKQDAMGLAQILEEKYGAIPTPAKIKLGISGCTFSCAESRLRDIGFIGTPTGWRMFVGGNSGMKPRIGDELAKELSIQKALALCQKFLDLYCETAPAQNRTSRFVEKMGIQTIKEKLGLQL
ncbi:NAD(P)/FAD-dependent oxidoreductase [Desulfobacter postgatei]|uniref:NAD(P)H-nitrite reductase n=1 Tax=Desulfobacter postgatei 2ac9 TaxID=879212 RepID=I5AZC3_9BACT|nr:NAD(P)/FAD-dependent oxidoreductase [Desulfobacter postgatei]EIM62586.1 NAD(P)H-nitrite reductase [Desulfobacter postgatei 2ac9]